MLADFTHVITAYVWPCLIAALFFGGSIFVHELGHFLAARRRGVHVERFSIGFGPPIFSWRGKDGVDYRLSWFPLGGYVLLPQMADLGAIEGESATDVSKLPPVGYATKMIVFVMGAVFNVLFAFALACIVWVVGQPSAGDLTTTTVAEVRPKLRTADNVDVVSPAAQAGLQAGDTIVAVDGHAVETFDDIRERLALSSGWGRDGERETVFSLLRDGRPLELKLKPVLSGPEKLRMVGFSPVTKHVVGRVTAGTAADRAGFKLDDRITAIGGKTILSGQHFEDALRANLGKVTPFTVTRAGATENLAVDLPADIRDYAKLGLCLRTGLVMIHPTPFAQIADSFTKTVTFLWGFINPRTDINLSHAQGPIGIIGNFVDASRAGLPFVLWLTILVNVNLAVLNLLPLPVLDGGHMLFATIGRLRGRSLPVNFIVAAQSAFLVLLLSVMLYVSFFDVRRKAREIRAERAEAAQPAPAATPAK